ncbi:CopG family ribbon-helix-helix protein [Gracilimonas mengyeensis]|uniref:Ribbon-helix-helix protein, copG family n=1 Tax=Gracilimonas mengyeensis TaxID=1302730 RepID=A0A521ABY7_9BACT|nr:ribbon-helix-helix protein, CopG family [Gracilimonas mengyeensis]SMO32325.1 Ribbon-helix-helix protein, copG family [Gracilimonas mengyeensis]
MRSIRLSDEMEKDLEAIADQKKTSRSNIVKEALVEYMAKEKKYNKPFELGERYFGKYGSGDTNRSTTYKSRLKEKLRDKHSH